MQRSTKIFSPTLTSSVPLQRLHTRRQMVIRQQRRSRNTAMPHLMSQCSFSGSLISKLPIWIPNNSVALFIWFCWENPQLPGCSFFIQGSWMLLKFCCLLKVKKLSKVIQSCSKLAALGSFTFWNARYSADWNGGGYLAPWGLETLFPHIPPPSFRYPGTFAFVALPGRQCTFPVLVLCSPCQ